MMHAAACLICGTAEVDVFPFIVDQPSDPIMRGLLYQPKYGACVFKCQLLTTFNRLIVGFDFPFLGVQNDGNILRNCMRRGKYPMHDWELLLADTAYASVPHCLCKKKKPRGRDLIFGELLLNSLISSDRARV